MQCKRKVISLASRKLDVEIARYQRERLGRFNCLQDKLVAQGMTQEQVRALLVKAACGGRALGM